ncbi:DUF4238 domain-containing protein [Flavobacterium aquidurense]|uniref:DUF4238 domain-containing protein n=1 Tax=Flavobacterium aquidurense TaxID=362413 RepID=UPI0037578CF4
MEKSQRHHYIPKFFIKKFTDDDGLLYVYNKTENRILRNKQSPKAVFFELNRNTLSFGGEEMDNLEHLYGDLDNMLAKNLESILKLDGISPEDIAGVGMLASMLKWRTPIKDSEFNEIKDDLSAEDLSIKIRIKGSDQDAEKEALKHIYDSEIFSETKRILLQILPLLNGEKLLDIHKNCFINTNKYYPALLGDSPLIEKTNTNFKELENFILPLSSDSTFIYKTNSKKDITNPMFWIHRDLATFHLSKKFVACRSKEHLEKIVVIYKQCVEENRAGHIIEFMFDMID